MSLPYVYNALKTLRTIHAPMWRDDRLKNIHFILGPKPWDEEASGPWADDTHQWWWDAKKEVSEEEKRRGLSQTT